MRAVVVDYGAGNLLSVERALARVGFRVTLTSRPQEIGAGHLVVLPGVGAFGPAARRLREAGLWQALRAWVEDGGALLGLCLGMQLLFEESEEDGRHEGLGLVPGRVVRLPAGVKVPHMGWNTLTLVRPSPVTRSVRSGMHAYFVHSYYALTDRRYVVAETVHGATIPALVEAPRVLGFQFHPEKSGEVGRRLLAGVREWLQRVR